MTVRKTIVPSFVILLAACLLISLTAFADEGQSMDEEYAPGFYYTVQKGDTLWDLSRKFYDSEWQWPAMWGQNKDLPNPHVIYPGQRIRLYQRTDPIKQLDSSATGEGDFTLPEEQIDGPELTMTETVYFLYPGIEYIGFIEKLLPEKGFFEKTLDDPLALGSILKAEGAKKEMITENDTVYIMPGGLNSAGSNDFIVGAKYSIYPPLKKVTDPATQDYAGHQFDIIGTAEITSISSEYVKAKITKSLDTIKAGCFIMPFERRDEEIAVQTAPDEISGDILMDESGAEMSSEYSIVFMNKGEKDGVKPGQRYDIYYQDKNEIDGKEVLLSQYVFGEMMVLLTRETTATAVITKSSKPIRRGDTFKSSL